MANESLSPLQIFKKKLHTHTHTHTHIYIYIYIYIYICRETGVHTQIKLYRKLKKCYLILYYLTRCIIRWGSRVRWTIQGKESWPRLYLGGIAIERNPSGRYRQLSVNLQQPCIYIYIYIYVCVCLCVCVCVWAYACIHKFTPTCIHTNTHAHTHMYMCAYVCEKSVAI